MSSANKMAVVDRFGLTKYQLTELMGLKGEEALQTLGELGGLEGIMNHLETNAKTGLSGSVQDLERRKVVFGMNYIAPVPPKSFFALVLDAIQDVTLIILIVAAIVSIVLGVSVEQNKSIAWIEGAAILGAVVLVVLVTAINDWTKERQFRGLQRKLETDTRFSVLRGGQLYELPLAEIVVGDVLQFKYGNAFPVDGLLIQGYDVKVDEASLTGEADLVKKRSGRDSILLGGTQVMEGGGKMVVTAVGPNSQQGIIFQLLTQKDDDAGFITRALRKFRDKIRDSCCKKEVDTSNEVELANIPKCRNLDDEKKDLDIEEIKYDPDLPPELKGWDRFNIAKRIKRRKVVKASEKSKESRAAEGVEAGSVLQRKLNKLAIQIGYAGIIAAVVCFIILTLKFVITEFGVVGRMWDNSRDFSELLHFVIISITVLVVAVPEGLPLAVTISLAFSVKKMLKDNNLVRHLHACETMGNATAICSDKTGTLTTNRMTVVESFFANTKYDVIPEVRDLPMSLLDVLKTNIAVNSSYTSKLLKETGQEEGERKINAWSRFLRFFRVSSSDVLLGQGLAKQVGNVTECALLGFIEELGVDYDAIREDNPTETFTKVFTFNSARKSMSTLIPLPMGGGHRLFTKGASEIVLAKCTSIIKENGQISPLSDEDKKDIVSTVVNPMASNSLRTIALAYRDFPADANSAEGISMVGNDWDNEDSVVSTLTCIGIVGIQDPVRTEVPGCIATCQKAGITVRMVTGDNVETARAIALKCGIISEGDGYLVLEGKELNKKIRDQSGELSADKFDRVWPRLRVLARSSPQDKYVLVDGIIRSKLRKNREVVAVTGDGTNDGPALKRADVGFAMGIAGTDVAKEASDIILTDDNFASIVKAVMWGRNVYDSISKFLQFQLTVNVVAVILTLVSAITIGDTPLRAVQLLWVNLIMDTLASLALATEPPGADLLNRKPYGRNKVLVTRYMALFIGGHSLWQLTVTILLLFLGPDLLDIDDGKYRELRATPGHHFTMIFNTFVFMQIFNEINARKIHCERNVFDGIYRNWIFLAVMAGQISVQIIIAQFGDVVFTTSGLTWDLWMWCIFLGSTELLIQQLLLFVPIKLIPNYRKRQTEQDNEEYDGGDPLDDEHTRARVLWMKSLTRLRTQIRVVRAFRSATDSASIWSGSLAQLQSTPLAMRHAKPVKGLETAV